MTRPMVEQDIALNKTVHLGALITYHVPHPPCPVYIVTPSLARDYTREPTSLFDTSCLLVILEGLI